MEWMAIIGNSIQYIEDHIIRTALTLLNGCYLTP